ncbi:MAG: hypothetical protein ACXAC2_16670, partial [Candidatus Kariarchaeaceae archaeon]
MIHKDSNGNVVKSNLHIGDLVVIVVDEPLPPAVGVTQAKVGRLILSEDHLTIVDAETDHNK